MESIPGAESKIQEYVARIQAGEDKESVLQGLGPAFRDPVEKQLENFTEIKNESATNNLDLTNKANISIETRVIDDENKIAFIRNSLNKENLSIDEINRRKKITGWSASYELAGIAQRQGIDLSKLNREEYAQFAIDNYLAIDDDQLRAQPWQRNEQSVESVVQKGRQRRSEINEVKEKEFAKFSYEIMELAKKDQNERYIKDGVRVLSGTKDSNSWLFFSINKGTNQEEKDTFKSYIALKDLNQFSPEQFVSYMEILQKHGYNGGVKIFQDLTEQGSRLNDQIVMHGFSENDALIAVDIAKEFFGENIEDTSMGKDEIVDGKSMSYSQILAAKIKNEINK